MHAKRNASAAKNTWTIQVKIPAIPLQISVHADMQSTKKSDIPMKNSKINPLVVKSPLESNCKRFRKSAIRENFNLKPETDMKKTHSNKR